MSNYSTNAVYFPTSGTSTATVSSIGAGGAGKGNVLISNGTTAQWGAVTGNLTAGNTTIAGNLYVSGQIYQNYNGASAMPDYTREWAMMTMIKLTKAEKDIIDLKNYINLLETKLDSYKTE